MWLWAPRGGGRLRFFSSQLTARVTGTRLSSGSQNWDVTVPAAPSTALEGQQILHVFCATRLACGVL